MSARSDGARTRRKKTRIPPRSRSVWIATAPGPSYAPLRGDIGVDVAIVGSGITGITAAGILKDAGLKVAVTPRSAKHAGRVLPLQRGRLEAQELRGGGIGGDDLPLAVRGENAHLSVPEEAPGHF